MGVLDWLLSAGAVGLMFVQGWWCARAQKTTADYFVGGRRMNWLAVGLAMFATTFSPLSFVGLPREAAYDNYHLYLAILFIPLFVVPVVGWLFVPLYHRLRLTSAYEYLELRFDRRLRRGGSLLFGLYTLGWMGSMLYATGLIVQAALGVGPAERIATMIVLGAVTAVYTTLGGYKATVWTNVIKSAVLAGVVVAVLLLAVGRVEGGWAAVWGLGRAHDKFAMFDLRLDLTSRATFFSACAFGLFVYLSVSVASQAAVQRYASMPSVGAARRLLVVHGVGTAVVCLLFFLLGSVMFAFYAQHPAGAPGGGGPGGDPRALSESVFPPLPRKDQLTMHFVRTELPVPGLSGLLLAGLFTAVMGSVSSGLNALSSLVVYDWCPGRQVGVGLGRVLSAVFGVATVVTSLLVPYLGEHVFDIIIRISGALFGPLLGLFLLGACVRRANTPGAACGLAAGLLGLVLIFPTAISPWWYGAFTCLPTLGVGIAASFLFPPPPPDRVRGLLVNWCGSDAEGTGAAPQARTSGTTAEETTAPAGIKTG
jgi:SSS family solute:Na+ symporter